jgi:hypothetical protein
MVFAGELHILSPSDMAGDVPTVVHIDNIVGAMKY